MKLSDAFNKMQLSVAKAQQAQTNGDIKLFNEQYNEVKGIQSQMSDSIQKLFTLSTNNVKAAEAADREARRPHV